MKSMRPDYKNWIPNGMLYGLIAGMAATLVLDPLRDRRCRYHWNTQGRPRCDFWNRILGTVGHHLLGELPLQLVLL